MQSQSVVFKTGSHPTVIEGGVKGLRRRRRHGEGEARVRSKVCSVGGVTVRVRRG